MAVYFLPLTVDVLLNTVVTGIAPDPIIRRAGGEEPQVNQLEDLWNRRSRPKNGNATVVTSHKQDPNSQVLGVGNL
jgi:hypothetical protein